MVPKGNGPVVLSHTWTEGSLSHLEEAVLIGLPSGNVPSNQFPFKILYLPRLSKGIEQALVVFSGPLFSPGLQKALLPRVFLFFTKNLPYSSKPLLYFPSSSDTCVEVVAAISLHFH